MWGTPIGHNKLFLTKASFWGEEIQLCMSNFSLSNCALNIPAMWPEKNGTEVESLARGPAYQP